MDWSDDYYNKKKTNRVLYLFLKLYILWVPRRSLLGHFWICCIANIFDTANGITYNIFFADDTSMIAIIDIDITTQSISFT